MSLEKRIEWDSYFIALARIAASRSTCLSRKVGAIIVKENRVISTGYNGALPGWEHCTELGYCKRRKRGFSNVDKYAGCVANHAETNAILTAAKEGISLKDATIYVTLFPCPLCMKQIIVAGIKEVVYEKDIEDEEIKKITLEYARQSNIKIRQHQLKEEEIKELERYLSEDISKRKLQPTK